MSELRFDWLCINQSVFYQIHKTVISSQIYDLPDS